MDADEPYISIPVGCVDLHRSLHQEVQGPHRQSHHIENMPSRIFPYRQPGKEQFPVLQQGIPQDKLNGFIFCSVHDDPPLALF